MKTFLDKPEDELRKKLKKTEGRHEDFTLLVALGGLVLLTLAERFPDVEWSSIGVFWFLLVMLMGYILR